MALLSTQVLPDNTLEEFRIEFNKLVTDVSGLSLGNTFDTQIIFEGTTDDTFETGLSVTDPTADRSIVFPDQSGNVLLDSANIALGDNIEIQFGDGTDLKIFHNGSNSIIRDNGTGSLFLEGSVVAIRNAAGDETMAQFTQDGAAALYHNNVSIMSTAATGISVAGDVVATDDLILDNDGALIQFGDDQEVTLTHVHNTGVLLNAAMVVQFRDSAINIGSPADGDLDINADDEIELNSTLIDINGNVEISGTLAQADAITMATNKKIIFRDAAIHISSTADGDLSIAADDEIDITSTLIDINGNVDISGTTLMTGVATHGGNVVSDTDSTDDLGTTGVRWANLYVDAITATDQITATGFTGTLDGILGSGAAAAATVTTLTSGGNIVSDTDSTDDLGTTGVRWANLFVDAITATDQITATGFTGTLDGILGSGAAAAATVTTLNTSGAVVHNDAGAAVDFRVEGDTDPFLLFCSGTEDEITIGGSTSSLFNGAGTSAKLAVIGSSNNTNIVQNGGAAIAIVNTDTTDENTAGLHFARADTDNTPNYAGASIVAQFKETQATGQYPSATLNFLTSPSQNAAPTLKMTLNEAGNLDVSGTYTGGGVMTTGGNIIIPDAGTIGSASDNGAISIAADGTVDLDTAGATVASSKIKIVGKESIWIPASAMYPSTTNGCAAIAQVETTALRPDLKVLDFDASSDEFAQFAISFPKSWNEGTVTFQPYWTVTGTNTGTVAWQLGGISVSSDDTLNTAFGTLVATTALAHSGTSNDLMVSVESGAVTIAGSPAVGDQCFFQINRDVSADAQTGDARLLGVKLFFTTDAANDA